MRLTPARVDAARLRAPGLLPSEHNRCAASIHDSSVASRDVACGAPDALVLLVLGERGGDESSRVLGSLNRASVHSCRAMHRWECTWNVYVELGLHALVRMGAVSYEMQFLGHTVPIDMPERFVDFCKEPHLYLRGEIPGALPGFQHVLLHALWCDGLRHTHIVMEEDLDL